MHTIHNLGALWALVARVLSFRYTRGYLKDAPGHALSVRCDPLLWQIPRKKVISFSTEICRKLVPDYPSDPTTYTSYRYLALYITHLLVLNLVKSSFSSSSKSRFRQKFFPKIEVNQDYYRLFSTTPEANTRLAPETLKLYFLRIFSTTPVAEKFILS